MDQSQTVELTFFFSLLFVFPFFHFQTIITVVSSFSHFPCVHADIFFLFLLPLVVCPFYLLPSFCPLTCFSSLLEVEKERKRERDSDLCGCFVIVFTSIFQTQVHGAGRQLTSGNRIGSGTLNVWTINLVTLGWVKGTICPFGTSLLTMNYRESSFSFFHQQLI